MSEVKRWRGMTPGEYREYMDELVKRSAQFYGGAHRFDPDRKCDLYCARCGAEQAGFNHRGQQS